jgi:hypothetical protein
VLITPKIKITSRHRARGSPKPKTRTWTTRKRRKRKKRWAPAKKSPTKRLAHLHILGWHNDASFCLSRFAFIYSDASPLLNPFFYQVEEDFAEIDPSAIIPQGRRTRGVRVDYTSKEALEKAGLKDNDDDESDHDGDVEMKD